MELTQFINRLQRNAGVQAFLPTSQGLLYPWFTLHQGILCAHFLANASEITPEGLVLYTPAFHIAAAYPQGKLLCLENLRCSILFRNTDFSQKTLIPKLSPEGRREARAEMAKLEKLAGRVLLEWDSGNDAAQAISDYHQQLSRILTGQQLAMYHRITGWE